MEDRQAGRRPGQRAELFVLTLILGLGVALRIVASLRHPLSFDEVFTATAGRLSFERLMAYLRARDSHPPLDYILRMPMARAGSSAAVMRIPSVVASTLALVVAIGWFRRFGRAGVLASGVVALAAFPVAYAGQARMYAGMMLVGVTAACLSDRWLHDARSIWAAAMAFVLLIGLFLHGSALFLAVGLFFVPGFRRDRGAWLWRAAILSPLTLWAAVWGPAFADQARGGHANWIPFTSASQLLTTLNELVDFNSSLAIVVVVTMITGLVVLGRRDRTAGWTFLVVGALPVGMIAIIGIRSHVLLSRSIAFAWWAPALGVGAVVDLAWRRARVLGAIAVATALLVVSTSTRGLLSGRDDPEEVAVSQLARQARPGDLVGVYPGWLSVLTRWYVDVTGPGAGAVVPSRSLAVDDRAYLGSRVGLRAGTDVIRVRGGPASGRAWTLRPDSYPDPAPGRRPCVGVQDSRFGDWIVACRQMVGPE